jgi:uncharacterized protein (TIGR00369 family)
LRRRARLSLHGSRLVGSACRDVAVERKGPFWDAVEGRAPLPAAAATLGWELVSINPREGTIEVAFTATEAFLNPAGVIQGGFLAAMLDDTLGPALVAGLEPGDFAPTTDLHVQFLRPTRPGRMLGRGRVVRRGRDVGFLAGELVDEEGAIVAVATATVQIRSQMLHQRERCTDADLQPTPGEVAAEDAARADRPEAVSGPRPA